MQLAPKNVGTWPVRILSLIMILTQLAKPEVSGEGSNPDAQTPTRERKIIKRYDLISPNYQNRG